MAPKALEKIRLSNNSLVEVAQSVLKAIRINSKLRVLDLSKNLIDLRCQREIELLVQKNRELHERQYLSNLKHDRSRLKDKITDTKCKTERELALATRQLNAKIAQLQEDKEEEGPEKQRIIEESKAYVEESEKNEEYISLLNGKLAELARREEELHNPDKQEKASDRQVQKFKRVKKDLKMYQEGVEHALDKLYDVKSRALA